MIKRVYIPILLLLAGFKPATAQDVHFSQFYANPLYLAPSFAGSTGGTRLVGVFRDQWPRIPGTYVSYAISADHFLPRFNSGFGLHMISDNAGNGKLVTTNVGLNYSYKVKLTNKMFLQPGLAAYYYSRKVDYSGINFADANIGGEFVGATSETLPYFITQHADFAISSLLYGELYWAGINLDHLMTLSPNLRSDFRYNDMRLSVFGGYKIPIVRRTRNHNNEFVHVAANYRVQSGIHQLDLGGYYNRKPFIVGIWYRGIPLVNEYTSSDALIYLVGLRYKEYVFSYSYDMSVGDLISQTGGSHEISISWTLDPQSRPKKYRSIPCPEL